MPWGVAAAVVGAAGSIYASNTAAGAAEDGAQRQQLQPFAVQTPFGSAQIDRGNLQVDAGAGAGLAQPFEQLAGGALDTANQTGFQPGLNLDPNQILQQALGQGSGAVQAFNQAGSQFLQGGQDLLANIGSFDQGAFAQTRFDQLNELARPGEENAANSLANRLFSQGRVGSEDSRSGRAFGELSQAQARSQTERGIMSQDAASNELTNMIQQAGSLSGFGGQLGMQGQQIQGQSLANFGQAINTGLGAQSGNLGFIQQLLGIGSGATGGIQQAFAPTRDSIQTLLAGSELQQSGSIAAGTTLAQSGNAQANLIGNVTGGIVSGLSGFANKGE